MPTSEVCVLGALLRHLRQVDPERARAVATAATRGEEALIEATMREGRLPADEAHAYLEAARFLVAGRHARVCARCLVQMFVATDAGTCPQCRGPHQRGVLAAPRTIQFDPTVESRVRRLILDSTSRQRARSQVAEARRLRAAGEIGSRPETEVAPREKSYAESVLGPYRLHDLVGRGGSSWVYRAEDTRGGRIVALKVFYVEADTPPATVEERMARFRREAELAGSLEHPHLVPVGPLEQSGPWYFLSMPFIDGPSLAHVLESRAANPAEDAGADQRTPLLAALSDVARGLHYAHCRGVVHRDVSPRNILFDAAGQACLSDFGAAKSLDVASHLTAARAVVGTLAYAAPERLQSETKADARSDVYSLGVILYEILTGRLPYREQQVAPLLSKILTEGPPPPRSLRPELPADLEALCLRAMQADAAKRPESALAFAEALTACLEGSLGAPATASPARPGADAAMAGFFAPARLRAFALGAVGATVVALLIASRSPTDAHAADLRPLEAAYRAWTEARGPARSTARESLARALAEIERTPVRDEPALRVWKAELAWGEGRTPDAEALLAGITPPLALRAQALRTHGLAAYFLSNRYGTSPRSERLRRAAREDFAELARAAGPDYDGRLAEAMLLLVGGDLDGAFAGFHELAREAPDRHEAALMEAWTALLGQAAGIAESTATALAQRRPDDPWALLLQGLARLAQGQSGPAYEIALRLRNLSPTMAEGAILQATAALAANQPVEADAAARTARDLDPLAPGPHRLRFRAATARGDPCTATAALARAVELEPDLDDLLFRLVALLDRHGNRTQARARAEEYRKRFPAGNHAEEARRLIEGD